MSDTTNATSGAGVAYPFGTPVLPLVIVGFVLLLASVFSVLFIVGNPRAISIRFSPLITLGTYRLKNLVTHKYS